MMWLAVLFGLAVPVEPPATCLKDCTTSPAGYELTRSFEGFMPFVYRDVAGYATVGFGHLLQPGDSFEGMLTPEQADTLLKKDVGKAEDAVNKLVMVELKQGQFDALMDFTFNLGAGAFKASSVLNRVNSRTHAEVPERILLYNKAGGVVIPGLARRRKAEVAMYVA